MFQQENVRISKDMYLLGFTVPEVDKIMEYYAEKSYHKYIHEFDNVVDMIESNKGVVLCDTETYKTLASQYAKDKVKRDFEQGWQGIEYKLNTVGSSRGDYPSTQAA